MNLSKVYEDDGTIVSLTPEAAEFTARGIVTCNRKLQEQVSAMESAAPTGLRMMIWGESGSQKQRYAEYVHRLSTRKKQSYMRFDCAATHIYQCEDALFGHISGSGFDRWEQKGMLEVSNGGTLLLDEISALPEFMYEKMNLFLEKGVLSRRGSDERIESDVRLLMTCSKDLEEIIGQNTKKAAFIQKIAAIHIHIAPLRERPEDVALLSLHYLQSINKRNGSAKKMGSALFREILAYPWPGNERELQSFIERTTLISDGDVLNDPGMLRATEPKAVEAGKEELEERSLKEMVDEYEIMLIRQSIQKHGSLRKAAKALKIAPSALSRKLSADRTGS